jgi:hypothetical protein
MIEVWEELDCESVGARELEAVLEAVRERFGDGALESPAATARLLADEGAELRHAEVLDMDARWRTQDAYEPMFRNVVKFSNFDEAAATIRRLDLRKQFARNGDREGMRRVMAAALKGKQRALMISRNAKVVERKREEKAEMAEWFTVWLNQPEIFEDWLALRRRSKEFRERFENEEARGSDE